MSNIFLVGATGKVGGVAARHLATLDGLKVHAGARDIARAATLLPDAVTVVPFDLDDRNSIDAALRGMDVALLLTGYSVDMLKQSKRFIDSARAAGVRHIVHVGASNNDTAEVAHWGWHKMIQAYIAASGMDFTFLHPEAFMDNLTGFGWLADGRLTNLIGDSRWGWVAAEDVGLLAAEALRRPGDFKGQSWHLAYDAATMEDVAGFLSDRLGSDVKTAAMSPNAFYEAAVAAGADPAYMACVRDQFHLNASGAIKGADTLFDPAAFKDATGRAPLAWSDYIERHADALGAAL